VGYRGLARESVIAPFTEEWRFERSRLCGARRSRIVLGGVELAKDDRAIDRMPIRLIVRSEGLWAHVSSALV